MQVIRVTATADKKGAVHLAHLPLHPDQPVEVLVLIADDRRAARVAGLSRAETANWQQMLDVIRASEPAAPTLDEAMQQSRGRP